MNLRAVLLVATLLAGCGFHLAGEPGGRTAAPAGLHIEGGTPEFRARLLRHLHAAGAHPARARADASLIVQLDGPEERRQTLTVTEVVHAREYELGLHLTVRAHAPDATARPVVLSRYRSWLVDAERYLAADEQRRVLLAELQDELIEALLLLLAARR